MSAARCERCGGLCRGGERCPMWGQARTARRVVGEPDLTDLDAVVGRVERIVAREEQHGGGNASLFDRYGCLLYDPSDAVIGNRSTLAVSDLRALLAALRAAREDSARYRALRRGLIAAIGEDGELGIGLTVVTSEQENTEEPITQLEAPYLTLEELANLNGQTPFTSGFLRGDSVMDRIADHLVAELAARAGEVK